MEVAGSVLHTSYTLKIFEYDDSHIVVGSISSSKVSYDILTQSVMWWPNKEGKAQVEDSLNLNHKTFSHFILEDIKHLFVLSNNCLFFSNGHWLLCAVS